MRHRRRSAPRFDIRCSAPASALRILLSSSRTDRAFPLWAARDDDGQRRPARARATSGSPTESRRARPDGVHHFVAAAQFSRSRRHSDTHGRIYKNKSLCGQVEEARGSCSRGGRSGQAIAVIPCQYRQRTMPQQRSTDHRSLGQPDCTGMIYHRTERYHDVGRECQLIWSRMERPGRRRSVHVGT